MRQDLDGLTLRTAETCRDVELAAEFNGLIHEPELAPAVLERRLARSPFAGLSRSLTLCFYRDSVQMTFAGGRLVGVAQGGPCDGSIRFPPLTFTPLLFGWRTIEQMSLAYPDLSVPDEDKLLVETLFPPMAGFVYPSY